MLYFTQIIYKAGVSEDRIAVLITPAKNKGGSYKWQKRENYMECETITCLVMRRDSAKLGGALMTNAVLQKNEEVLRNLLATLLEMDEADIVDCHLENPIELGKEIEGKECILDVKLTLNNAKIINIELQVYKQTYWVERSLLYWASIFKAETLEELEQLANGEEVFEKMVVTMKKLSEDEKIRMQCEAREDYERCLLSEFNAGKREGEEIGEKRGEKRGRIAGKAEALTELINNLMETQHISEEEAKKMLKL